MFLNKNKINKDSRIRFQNSRFKHRLSEARGYKRHIRNKPADKGEIFLSKIGLGSWYSRFALLLVFFILIYLVFIPNIFFIKNIAINDPQTADKPAIQSLVNSFLEKNLPWPQKNLILLSKSGLAGFLQKNDQEILNVASITKKFPSSLVINVTPRVDSFAIQTAGLTYFSVSGDGLVTNEVFLDASGTLPSGLTLVKLDNSGGLTIGRPAFSQSRVDFFNQIQNQLPGIVKSPMDYFELGKLDTPDFTAYFTAGPKILASFNSDIGQILSRLRLLLSQFSDSDIKKLYYVDMRFGDSGYICYKGTPCVQDISLPKASTTPANLLN